MGEVFRATDCNLKRSVAIKVLPTSVAGDVDRLARFQREAEVLAALNHFSNFFDQVSRSGSACAPSALSLLNLREEELLQRFVREPECRRFLQRLVRVPTIDDRAFHEPHPGSSSTASSMDERRLDARRGDRLQKRVDDRGIRRRPTERDVVIGNTGHDASQPSTVRSGASLLHALGQAVHSNGFDDRADQISGAQRGD